MSSLPDFADWTFVNLTPHDIMVNSISVQPPGSSGINRQFDASQWTMRCSQTPPRQAGTCGQAKVLEAPRFSVPAITDKYSDKELLLSKYGEADDVFFSLIEHNVRNKGKLAVLVSMPVGDWFRRHLTVQPGQTLPFGWLEPWSRVAILGPNTAPRRSNTDEGALRDDKGQIYGTTGFVAYYLP